MVRDQLEVLLAAYPIAAIKTGMLLSSSIIRTVADLLRTLNPCPPLVIDPVMVASSGTPLLKGGAMEAYRKYLFPLAMLITPNLDELGILTDTTPNSLSSMRSSGKQLTATTGTAVLLKGGHLRGRTAIDLLLMPDWEEWAYSAPFLRGIQTHGTGCTYSAAIAAGLAKGLPLSEAVGEAKKFIIQALENTRHWGVGTSRVSALDQVSHRAP
jgi:hydroxymethylpyrimidine/phosphomethylpyrimidine kinase